MKLGALQVACIYRYSYLMRIGNVDMCTLSFRYNKVSTFNVSQKTDITILSSSVTPLQKQYAMNRYYVHAMEKYASNRFM